MNKKRRGSQMVKAVDCKSTIVGSNPTSVSKRDFISKEDFLKRCEMIYDLGLVNRETLAIMRNWCDAIMRYEGNQMTTFQHLIEYDKKRTKDFTKTLASDVIGYKVIQMTYLLAHPCQKCAEDKNAWHTRYAFCDHKKRREIHG